MKAATRIDGDIAKGRYDAAINGTQFDVTVGQVWIGTGNVAGSAANIDVANTLQGSRIRSPGIQPLRLNIRRCGER